MIRNIVVAVSLLASFVGMSRADINDAVVSVEAKRPGDDSRSAGNGVCVTPGIVLTCHHVVDGKSLFQVTFPNRKRFRCELVTANRDYDLAVLRFDGDDVPFCPVRENDLKEGDGITLIGDWSGADQPIRRGKIIPEIKNTRLDLQTNITVGSGDSGGGIFDADGNVVGILSGYWPDDPKRSGMGADTKAMRHLLSLVPSYSQARKK